MNVNIKNLEELLTNIKRFKQEVESHNQDLRRNINQYINDDRYSSKAFDKSKRKMKEVVLPIFDQYIIVLQTMEKDLYECINHYHNEVDVINLDERYLEELINKVRREREKEERKLELSRRFNTNLAHSFGLSYRFDRSYGAACQLERLLIRKRENLSNFDKYHFFNKTRDEIGKLNYLVNKLDKSNIKGKVTKDSMVCNIVDTLTKFDVPPKIEDYTDYNSYLRDIGEYLVKLGIATKIEINGITYYELKESISHLYYGDPTDTRLQITCLKDGTSYVYYTYGEDNKCIGVPNGLLYLMDEKGNPIKDKDGNYIDLFSSLIDGTYDKSKYHIGTITNTYNDDIYKELPGNIKKMCDSIAINLSTAQSSNDLSEAILIKDIVDERGRDYIDKITWEDIENQAKKYIPNGQDFSYFTGEVQMHADGARYNKSIDSTFIQGLYAAKNVGSEAIHNMDTTLKNTAINFIISQGTGMNIIGGISAASQLIDSGILKEIEDYWDKACSNADLGRSKNEHENEMNLEGKVTKHVYYDEQLEITNKKRGEYENK